METAVAPRRTESVRIVCGHSGRTLEDAMLPRNVKGSGNKRNRNNGAMLGFEHTLWRAADKRVNDICRRVALCRKRSYSNLTKLGK